MVMKFGSTWWGKAWVEALEQRAGLDANRLPRGRTYARHDRVARLEMEPGRISALVRGSRVLPYKVTVGVRTFDDETWAKLTAAIAGRAAHAAALLDGELDPALLDDAAGVGVDLLPGPGDLQPRCSCPDYADPCKHSAAVCYLVANALDDDPFALFALRGRDREALLAEVRARRQRRSGASGSGAGSDASSADGGSLVDPGVAARQAWETWRERREAEVAAAQSTPVGDPRLVGGEVVEAARGPERGEHREHLPEAPGTPSEWPTDPPADAPFTAEGLHRLAADAAQRAWSQLADGAPSGLLLGTESDLARRAANLVDAGEPLTELARSAGETPTSLANRASVWRHAGEEGLESANDALWRPPESALDAGRAAFEDAGVDPSRIQVRSNRLTVDDVQLRITPDGRWWRYEKRGRLWDLVEAPSSDPGDLVG